MAVIFSHRVRTQRRHYLLSAVIPYVYIFLIGLGILLVSFIAGAIETHSGRQLGVFGWDLSLEGTAIVALYVIGILGEVLLLTSFYLVMPGVHITFRHALMGGMIATVLWEITRRVLVWYYSVVSSVNLIYGSFATSVVALISMEAIAVIILLGAQVIAEVERRNSSGHHSTGR
jgi:YihY family inner membrane protein